MSLLPSIKNALGRFPADIKRYGVFGGIRHWAGMTYIRAANNLKGEVIWDRDWDVLVILDACRLDLLQEVQDEYEWLPQVENSLLSVGTTTQEWTENTYSEEYSKELQETAYIGANPHSRHIPPAELCYFDEVWRTAWDERKGTVPPENVTDRAIHAIRNSNCNRYVIHYMQPHAPFVTGDSHGLEFNNFTARFQEAPDDDWVRIQRGERDVDEVWADYRNTLRWVLDDLERLIENVSESTLVISADHGNAAGEYGLYGHDWRMPISAVQEVPWVTLGTTDQETFEGEAPPESDKESLSVEEKLQALGYK